MKVIVIFLIFSLLGCHSGDRMVLPESGRYFVINEKVYLNYEPGDVLIHYTVLHDNRIISRDVNNAFPGSALDDEIFKSDGLYGVYYTIANASGKNENYFFVKFKKHGRVYEVQEPG